MRKNIFSGIAALLLCTTTASAQNPIIRDQFTADPTARVFNGKLYLFPSHDIPAPEDFPRKDWFCMADYHVFSSDNLTDWTDHGVIVDQKNVPWGNPTAYSMWAPDCVEKDGKYYFYFPNAPKPVAGQRGGGFGVGVAIADNPWGPYIPQPNRIAGLNGIDPCVLQASNGENVIFWGAGGIVQAKLKDNLLELDGEPQRLTYLPQAGLQEGPFAFERNGKYYLTYPWVRYKKGDKNEKGEVLDNPTEALVYCMSDSPMGPWEYKGVIMKEHENGCWTNHHSIVEFKGQWYIFYHHNDYSPSFDKNRSACVDSLFFNADGTIQEVKPSLRGVGISDARKLIQIDRYSTVSNKGASISYLNPANTFEGWQMTYNGTDAYSTYNRVDFGQKQVNTITVRVKAPQGAVLVVKDISAKLPTRWGNRPVPQEFLEQMKQTLGIIASIEVPATSDFTLITLPINNHPRGVVDLKLQSRDGREISVDWITFDMQPELHPALLQTTPLQPLSKGGMETGKYRNLFAELGYTDKQIDDKQQELFDALFTGPDRIYFELPGDKAIISDVKNHDARTEGMSYGMMIAVQMNKKDIFDRLFRWAKEYMQMKDGRQKGYFAWSVKPDGTQPARGAAADGELYFITSLLFASNQWGNDTGINYLAEAQYILNTILGETPVDDPNAKGKKGKAQKAKKGAKNAAPANPWGGQNNAPMTPQRLIDEKTKLIAFTPGSNYTDPSYHLPAFYEVWAKYAQDGRSEYWLECAKASREYLHKSIHPVTGLNPDYNNFDGSLMKTGRTLGDAFRYDSWRVPMNIALDFSWSHADADWQTNYGHKLQNFLYSQGIDTFLDQYNVDGTTVTDTLSAGGYKELRHTPGFVATSAALSLVCTHSKSREFVDRFWNNKHQPTPSGYFDGYYEGILRLFAFLHLSGRYRVIEPKK